MINNNYDNSGDWEGRVMRMEELMMMNYYEYEELWKDLPEEK